MIPRDELLRRLEGIDDAELERWLRNAWLLPEREGEGEEPLFEAIDLARAQLIRDMREMLAVEEETMPLVLSLLDEVYRLRRRLKALCVALDDVPEGIRRRIAEALAAE